MATSDSITAVRPAWKAQSNNAVSVADDESWPPLSRPAPSKFPDDSKNKGIRGLSPQSQLPPHQTMHHSSSRRPNHHPPRPNHSRQFMPQPPPPLPNYVPPPRPSHGHRFMRPPPPPLPNYVSPPRLSLPFESPFTYIYVPTLPPAAVPTPIYYPPPCELRNKIIQQIEYYFCEDNLAKDVYLRSKMDGEGWVCVQTIASFPQVTKLTNSTQVILDSLAHSITVEVKNGNLRRRGNWNKWLLPTSTQTGGEISDSVSI